MRITPIVKQIASKWYFWLATGVAVLGSLLLSAVIFGLAHVVKISTVPVFLDGFCSFVLFPSVLVAFIGWTLDSVLRTVSPGAARMLQSKPWATGEDAVKAPWYQIDIKRLSVIQLIVIFYLCLGFFFSLTLIFGTTITVRK